ncbi:MAG: hypothetical protein H6636_04030 [Anaerolineales bacterium]|nr:hypothetical protein [Anaerolineales bacterium]
MTFRRLFYTSLLLLPLFLASLACNYVLAPFLPPTPTPTIPAIAELPRQFGELRPPTATPTQTPTATPTNTPTNTPEPTATATLTPLPSPTIDLAKLSDPDRPRLSGQMLVYGTEHFLIHYTNSGEDLALVGDGDGSGIPDYVEQVGAAMELSWQVEIVQLGWAAPPSDGGVGGDARYDVYLKNIYGDGTAGYTDGGYRSTTVGDNPNTPVIENDASYSYITIDNDFREDQTLGAYELMQVTAAHEFNHAIQFGYDGNEPADWLWEASATWMEDMVYDDINDGVYYLDAVFGDPGACQIAEESRGGDYHWYGMWIFIQYISEQYGPEVIRTIWENTVTHDGYGAIEAALATVGTSLDDVFRNYGVALLTHNFEEGVTYPVLSLKGEVVVGNTFRPNGGVFQMGADYLSLVGLGDLSGTASIRLQGGDAGWVVGVRGGEADIYHMQAGLVNVDGSIYDYIYLIVFNLARANREAECTDASYAVTTGTGDQASEPAQTIAIPNFRLPRFGR